jgi:SAM-dependent methyltransferase
VADQTSQVAFQVRQLFDAKAAAWPLKYAPDGRLSGRLTRLAGAVAHHVPAGGSVLDLGCGTGELARAIAAAGQMATGCDISPGMLHHAAAADRAGTVDWVQLDPGWQELPFAPGTFDAVVAASVLEYVDDPMTVLRECFRVLRPGGTVLCTVPDPRHPVRWMEWLLAVAARLPLVRLAGRRWPRLGGYLTYLRISRQRHRARWWRVTTAQADLRLTSRTAGGAGRSPLRLLAFQRPGPSGEN